MRSVSLRNLVMALACVLCSGTGLTWAQLSDQDITALQERGASEGWTFTVARNEATDYALSDLCGMVEPPNWQATARFETIELPSRTLPTHFDWREYNACTPIRNQGGCGSCWAFGTVGSLECNIRMYTGYAADLSEQWLVSCNRDGWSCSGGWWAHDYHKWKTDNCGGTWAVPEAAFLYQAQDLPCNCPYPHQYTMDGWAFIDGYNIPPVESIKQAILDYGPVSVCVYADGAFQGYGQGIFNACASGNINHAVVLVGWNDADGGCWIMRNSWGSGWGEQGYMRIRYNCSSIGYATTFIRYRPYLINGYVTRADGTGVPGVTMSGLPRNPVTAENGYFSTRTDGNWSATVTPTRPGFSIAPVSRTYTNIAGNLSDVNFTAAALPLTVSGHVRKAGGAPIANVTLVGLPGNPVTGADGYYSAGIEGGWSGGVMPSRPGCTFSPIYRTYTDVGTDLLSENYTGTVPIVLLSGYVRRADGQGVPGVSLYGLPGTYYSMNGGRWAAWLDIGWSGTVTPGMDCMGFAPLSLTYVNVTENLTDQNFGASDDLPSISGNVRNAFGAGVSGVVLNGLPGSPATDATGYYDTAVSCGFAGTVTPVESEYVFDPAQRTYGDGTFTDQTSQDFAATPLHDCNHNGVADVRDITGGTSFDDNSNGVPDECEYVLGDLNCDGAVGFDDINAFVLAISGHAEYRAVFPTCLWRNGDFNGDGTVDFDDIDGFVAALSH